MKRPVFYHFGPPPRQRSNLLKIRLQFDSKIIAGRASTEQVPRRRCSGRCQRSGITSQDPASVGGLFRFKRSVRCRLPARSRLGSFVSRTRWSGMTFLRIVIPLYLFV
jgi:hypothetical protein